jgi:hypothetical protein
MGVHAHTPARPLKKGRPPYRHARLLAWGAALQVTALAAWVIMKEPMGMHGFAGGGRPREPRKWLV